MLNQYDFRPTGGAVVRVANAKLSAAGQTEWLRLEATVVIAQLAGDATDVSAVVERSAVDPALVGDAYAAPAGDDPISGDLTAGVAGNAYMESGVGWWRIRVTSITGGDAYCAVSGKGG